VVVILGFAEALWLHKEESHAMCFLLCGKIYECVGE
jgi:hypothetical protein